MHLVDVVASQKVTLEDLNERVNIQKKSNTYRYQNDYKSLYYLVLQGYEDRMPTAIRNVFHTMAADVILDKMSVIVNKPGIYMLPHLSKNSDGKFRRIFFSEIGRYSLVKIYKFMRSAEGISWEQKGMIVDQMADFLSKPLTDECPIKTIENKELAYIVEQELMQTLPYDFITEKGLANNSVFIEMQNLVKKISFLYDSTNIPEVAIQIDLPTTIDKYNEYLILHERYIPLVITRYTGNYYQKNKSDKAYLDKEGHFKPVELGVLPGVSESGENYADELWTILSNNTLLLSAGVPTYDTTYYTGWYRTVLDILAFDIETNSIIRSRQLSREVHDLMRVKSQKDPTIYSEDINAILSNESGTEFEDRFYKYMASRGFINFKINSVIPIYFRDAAEVHNWKDGNHVHYEGAFAPRFCVSLSYKNKLIIGGGVNSGSWVIMEADESGDVKMVQSAWCQRVSKWTKRYNIDQKNTDWYIDDWLSGPFAEKNNLRIQEAPIVFFGNKSAKVDKKKHFLQKMRDIQASLN